MILFRLTVSTLAVCLGAALPGAAAWAAPPQPAASGYGQDRGGWDAPPRELRGVERQGFQDGMEGARRDFGNHRRPDVDNRDEYRHPPVSRGQWDAYRRGFRRGYEQAAAHLWGAPMPPVAVPQRVAPPPPPPQAGWGMHAGSGDGIREQGFHDGMEGAMKDFGNHRPPTPENRDEFRHPPVPYPMQQTYRDSFRRGYRMAVSELNGGDARGMAAGPYGDVRMHGFQDGMEGALRDFGNNRPPSPDNRDEYRHPDVSYQLQGAYREGFRRGYQLAFGQLTGEFQRR